MAEGTSDPTKNELLLPDDKAHAGSSGGKRKRKRDESQDKQQSPFSPQLKKLIKYEPRKMVPDHKVKTFPYQSVGLLEYSKVNIKCGKSRDSYSTAWVVHAKGYHIVITSAHSLKRKDERATNIRFTPGFIPGHPPRFGVYDQVPGGEGRAWAVHPEWNPHEYSAKYDIGIVHLARSDENFNFKYVDDAVTPIQMLSKPTYNTIGYSEEDKKMYEQVGALYRRSRSGPSFYKHGKLPKCTSGGPMMFISDSDNSSKSIGIMAGNTDFDGYPCLQSPYFTSTIDEMVKLWFSR